MLLGKELGCFGGYFVHIWILAEGIADKQKLFSFVGEVVSYICIDARSIYQCSGE